MRGSNQCATLDRYTIADLVSRPDAIRALFAGSPGGAHAEPAIRPAMRRAGP